jgi:hypothetical protein
MTVLHQYPQVLALFVFHWNIDIFSIQSETYRLCTESSSERQRVRSSIFIDFESLFTIRFHTPNPYLLSDFIGNVSLKVPLIRVLGEVKIL